MQKINFIGICLLSLAFLFGCASKEEPPMPKPSMEYSQEATTEAEIVSIDNEKKEVTLRLANGESPTLKAHPKMENFDQLKVGDIVEARIHESIVLSVATEGEVGLKDSIIAGKAKKGDMPAIGMEETIQVSSKVVAIDYETRNVTLLGPKGIQRTYKVGPEAKNLEAVKVDDIVTATITVGMVLSARHVE